MTVALIVSPNVTVMVAMTPASRQQNLETSITFRARCEGPTLNPAINSGARHTEAMRGLPDRHPIAARNVTVTVMVTAAMIISVTVRHDVTCPSGLRAHDA